MRPVLFRLMLPDRRRQTADWLGIRLANATSIEHAAHQVRLSSHCLPPAWTRRLLRPFTKPQNTYPRYSAKQWSDLLRADQLFQRVWLEAHLAICAAPSAPSVRHGWRQSRSLQRVTEMFAFQFSRESSAETMMNAAKRVLGKRPRWVGSLLERAKAFAESTNPPQELADLSFETWTAWLLQDRSFLSKISDPLEDIHDGPAEPMMLPAGAAVGWNVPELLTVGQLAHWLGIAPDELHWLANLEADWKLRGLEGRHYNAVAHQKRFGEVRIIEAPRTRLKQVQRRILDGLLCRIPCHPAVHGFVPGRSTRTFAAPHVQAKMVIRIDLRNFFVTIRRAQACGFFKLAGYPPEVANVLASLCASQLTEAKFNRLVGSPSEFSKAAGAPTLQQTRRLYTQPHLPQGAPTSPMLANLCTYRLDGRLAGLSESIGGCYTRYADDLVFSADIGREQAKRFTWLVAAIVMDEGFCVHDRKTKLMRRGTRQRIAGVVVNRHTNVSRQEYDRLKAILNNCIQRGAETQNRESHDDFRAHLAGRLSHVMMLNPTRGAKLRRLFEQIDWHANKDESRLSWQAE